MAKDVIIETEKLLLRALSPDMLMGRAFSIVLFERLELSAQVLDMALFYQSFPATFDLTPQQWQHLNDLCTERLEATNAIFGEDTDSIVKRLGAILFRIAMILTACRQFSTAEAAATLICEDQDFESACLLTETYTVYTPKPLFQLAVPPFPVVLLVIIAFGFVVVFFAVETVAGVVVAVAPAAGVGCRRIFFVESFICVIVILKKTENAQLLTPNYSGISASNHPAASPGLSVVERVKDTNIESNPQLPIPVTFFLDEKSNQKNQGFIEIQRLRGAPLPKIWLFKKTRCAQTLFKKPNFASGTAAGLAPSEFL